MAPDPGRHYVGRFAPSPTGPLHFGSLVSALGSYLSARASGGEWLLRIDDADPWRSSRETAASILRALEALGLHWDRSVEYQQPHRDDHRAARDALLRDGRAYRCRCSRRMIGDRPYPGTCRSREAGITERHAVRVRVDPGTSQVNDSIQGLYRIDLTTVMGDYVIWRVEDLPAYHLATVIDDARVGVTDIVRGADLLPSTPVQMHLQRLLGLPAPAYAHLPVAVGADGHKLSKQTGAAALDLRAPAASLRRALAFLGQQVPAAGECDSPAELLAWATPRWRRDRVPCMLSRAA